MVTVTGKKLVIEIPHVMPDDLQEDLQKALFNSLRALCDHVAMDASLISEEEFGNSTSALLDLLYAMILDKEE